MLKSLRAVTYGSGNRGEAPVGGGDIGWTTVAQIGAGLAIPFGTDFSVGSLAYLGNGNVAVHNTAGLGLYNWDGANFALVGNHSTVSTVTPTITPLGPLTVALAGSTAAVNKLSTFTHNGTDWVNQGGDILTNVGTPGIAALNSTDIAYHDGTSDSLRTYRWSGGVWSQPGNQLAVGAGTPGLAALNSTDIAIVDPTTGHGLTKYRFDGTDWSQVGNIHSDNSFVYAKSGCGVLNETDIVIVETNTNPNNFEIWRFDGTDWAVVNTSVTTEPENADSINGNGNQQFAGVDATDFIYLDSQIRELRYYRYSFV